jgi:hypothetical protein
LRIFLRRFFRTLAIRSISKNYARESSAFPIKKQAWIGMLTSFQRSSYTARMAPLRRHAFGPVLLFMTLILAVGCSGKTLQYKEDHERLLRIDKAVESLRKAYVERDRAAFEALFLPSGHLDQLQREIEADFDVYRDVQLEFAMERILIEGENIDVFVHWQGQWRRNPDEAGIRQRGHARLGWVGTQSILLRDAQGDLPFGMVGRASQAEEPARTSAPR